MRVQAQTEMDLDAQARKQARREVSLGSLRHDHGGGTGSLLSTASGGGGAGELKPLDLSRGYHPPQVQSALESGLRSVDVALLGADLLQSVGAGGAGGMSGALPPKKKKKKKKARAGGGGGGGGGGGDGTLPSLEYSASMSTLDQSAISNTSTLT
jgi:hypothetical protein